MRRKEVVLGELVFDLGLKAFEKVVTQEKRRGKILELDVGSLGFQCRISIPDLAFIMHWVGRTNLANVIWTRFISLKLEWPPVKSISCFTNALANWQVHRS